MEVCLVESLGVTVIKEELLYYLVHLLAYVQSREGATVEAFLWPSWPFVLSALNNMP